MRLYNHDEFIEAIRQLHEVNLTFASDKGGGAQVTRRCAPMDYGPARISARPDDRYHFWMFESPEDEHQVALSGEKISSVVVLTSSFDPADFVSWDTNWNVPRTTWGIFN